MVDTVSVGVKFDEEQLAKKERIKNQFHNLKITFWMSWTFLLKLQKCRNKKTDYLQDHYYTKQLKIFQFNLIILEMKIGN